MKILELFAGSRSIGKIAERMGFEVLSSDINDFENISYSKNNKQRIDRWRKQLKYMALDIYDIKISEQKLSLKNNKEFKLKSNLSPNCCLMISLQCSLKNLLLSHKPSISCKFPRFKIS